jgi:hypothetical protein
MIRANWTPALETSKRPINVRCPRPDAEQTGWPNCGHLERWGVAQILSGVPDVTLTCTSMPRWSDGSPMKVPWTVAVVRIAHDRNGDKTDLADAAARGVEIDPAGAWQIDLRPGRGRPAS